MRRLGSLAPICVLFVAVATAALVVLGPPAVYPGHPRFVRDAASTLQETTDRLVFVAWIVIALLSVLVLTMGSRLRWPSRWRLPMWLTSAVSVASLAIAVESALWEPDPAWPGVTAVGLIVGLAAAVGIGASWRASRPVSDIVTLAGLGIVLAVVVPTWLQLPGSIRDAWHFQFTAEELAAPAAGRIPLVDFFPQYSNLLGWPLAPVLKMIPAYAPATILIAVVLLQGLAVAGAVALPVMQGGVRMLLPAMAVMSGPLFMATGTNTAPSSYFANFPLRDFLPLAAIFVCYSLFRRLACSRPRAAILRSVVVGAVSGLAALNNPDFGLAVVVATGVGITLWARPWRLKCGVGGAFLLGVLAPFGLYWAVLSLGGHRVQWDTFLLSQVIFGSDGYLSEAMRPYGPHVALVSLFIVSACAGVYILRRSVPGSSTAAYGLLLTLVGSWSLLCLPYFVGRSLNSTLMGAFAFHAGLVTACLLPLLRAGLRAAISSGERNPLTLGSLGLGFVAVAACIGSLMTVSSPSIQLGRLATGVTLAYPPVTSVASAVDEVATALGTDRVAVATSYPGLASLDSGSVDGSVVSNPLYFEVADRFVELQCQSDPPAAVEYLIVESVSVPYFESNELCSSVLDLGAAQSVDVAGATYTALPFRRG